MAKEEWVKLYKVFGVDSVPQSAADIIILAIATARANGDITNNPWAVADFITKLCANYLAEH